MEQTEKAVCTVLSNFLEISWRLSLRYLQV